MDPDRSGLGSRNERNLLFGLFLANPTPVLGLACCSISQNLLESTHESILWCFKSLLMPQGDTWVLCATTIPISVICKDWNRKSYTCLLDCF